MTNLGLQVAPSDGADGAALCSTVVPALNHRLGGEAFYCSQQTTSTSTVYSLAVNDTACQVKVAALNDAILGPTASPTASPTPTTPGPAPAEASRGLGCRDEAGHPVDWFFIYKLPDGTWAFRAPILSQTMELHGTNRGFFLMMGFLIVARC